MSSSSGLRRARRASFFAASMWGSLDASTSARVLPVDLPTLPSGRRQGATQTRWVQSKYSGACPFGPLPATVKRPVEWSTTSLPTRCLWHAAPPVGLFSDHRLWELP